MTKIIQTFPNEEKLKYEYLDSVKFPYGIFVFFEKILEILRNDHNLLCKILSNVEGGENKQMFGKFFANYLNSNFFSKTPLQDVYMLVLTRMLQEEINKKPSVSNFLSNDSICKYLLSDLYKVDEIKNYFIQILQPCIAEMECWKEEISFKLEDIMKKKEEKKEEKKEQIPKDISVPLGERPSINFLESNENSEQIETNQNYELEQAEYKKNEILSKQMFKDKYLKNLNATILFDFYEKTVDIETQKYLQKHIDIEDQSEDKMNFAIELFLFEIKDNDMKLYEYRLDLISNFFGKCSRIVGKIINKMNKYSELVPHSIRTILKIIESLIKNTFNSVDIVGLYGYLSCFLINIVMESMLTINPDKNGLIDSTLLTPNTQHNIKLLLNIIKQLCKGDMFSSSKDEGYTLFNIFFIENYKLIGEFFKNILQKTKIPSIIEDLILSKNNYTNNGNYEYEYEYEYFQRNPKEHICGIMYFIDIDFVLHFLDFLNKNIGTFDDSQNEQQNENEKSNFSRLLTCLDKSYSQDKIIKLKKTLVTFQNQKRKIFYGTFTEKFSPEFTKIKNLSENPFLFQLSTPKDEISKSHLHIKNIKNSLCKLLYNTYSLENICLAIKINNLKTDDLINLITKANNLNYESFENDNEILWCANTLSSSFEILPDEYKSNDYSLIYDEILNELESEKKELTTYYNVVSTLNETMRHVEKRKEQINLMYKCSKEEKISQAVKKLIMENNSFHYSFDVFDKKGKMSLTLKMEYKSQKGKTLYAFCEDFPNLNKLYNKQDRKPFKVLKTINILEIFMLCFTKIKKSIIENYFNYELRNIISQEPPQLSSHEKNFYNEEQQKKIIQDIIARDDKEIRERFIKECNYKKKTKTEQIFYLYDIPFINRLHELLKEFVMNRLYESIFPNKPTEQDKNLKDIFDALSFYCKPSNLNKEIQNENIIIASIPKAKKYIKRFDNERTPLSKKRAYIKLMELIKHITNYNKKETATISAVDDTIPVFIFFVIKAAPERYNSSLRYLELFWPLFEEVDDAIITTLKSPKLLLKNLDAFSFKNLSSQSEFDKLLDAAFSKKEDNHHSKSFHEKNK